MNCLIWLSFGILMGTILLIPSVTFKIDTYAEKNEVVGTIEYAYTHNKFIAFAINEDNIEYRLSSIYIDEFDYSFYDVVKNGDPITFYADKNTHIGKSFETNKNSEICYVYYVNSNGIEYFSYEDMVKGEIDNINVAKYGCIISYSIASIAIVSATTFYFVCQKKSIQEINALR